MRSLHSLCRNFVLFLCALCGDATVVVCLCVVYQIVDVETKEFLFYINATDPRRCNWMRYINCARFFEEQNILSEQDGIDIFYQAIKVDSGILKHCYALYLV